MVVVEEAIRERGYSDYRVLAQLGFGLARALLALAWLELGWALTIFLTF